MSCMIRAADVGLFFWLGPWFVVRMVRGIGIIPRNCGNTKVGCSNYGHHSMGNGTGTNLALNVVNATLNT